jgi:hypothetical protein
VDVDRVEGLCWEVSVAATGVFITALYEQPYESQELSG